MIPKLPAALGLALLLPACAAVLEEQHLPVSETTGAQQSFALAPEPLTIATASKLNSAPYLRRVVRGGIGQTADLVPEQALLVTSPPASTEPLPYRIGLGDDLELVLYRTTRNVTDEVSESVAARSARVGGDGTILFVETGRLELRGRTVAEARDLVASALVRNGIDPRFQLEVRGFNSQTVNLTVVSSLSSESGETVPIESGVRGTGSYPVTDRPLTLRQLLVTAGLEITRSGVQIVRIIRGGRQYQMPIDRLFEVGSPDYYLTGGDTVQVEQFAYAKDRAYVLGGGAQPASLPLSAETRPTLADILFVEDGPFATKSARNREIYLLRGTEPMRAYHLDAGDPSRLAVAAMTELRPNDIVYLSSKPIYVLSELLGLINPLAVLAQSSTD